MGSLTDSSQPRSGHSPQTRVRQRSARSCRSYGQAVELERHVQIPKTLMRMSYSSILDLPWSRTQYQTHALGVTRDNLQIGSRWLIGLSPSLLPIAQGADRDLIAQREFFLSKTERPPQGLHPRHPFGASQFCGRHRACIGIRCCSGFNLRLRHRTHGGVREVSLQAVLSYLSNLAVRANFRGSSRLPAYVTTDYPYPSKSISSGEFAAAMPYKYMIFLVYLSRYRPRIAVPSERLGPS